MDTAQKSPLKKIGIILLIISVKIALVLIFLFYIMPRFIYKQKGCDAFNIDNMELHTHIDIPQNKVFSCDYNSKKKLKRIYFIIDKSRQSMPRYISFSGFSALPAGQQVPQDDFLQINIDSSAVLFCKEQHKKNGEYYKALLDTASGAVWINLHYAD